MTKKLITVCGLLLPFALAALASDYDKRTVITLNDPVMVAGVQTVTLPPGKYVIKLMNHASNRHIVEIYNEREDELLALALALPHYRLQTTDETVLRYWETPAGNPAALRTWFYPGDQWGQEFVYPKGLAAKIAERAGEPVLAIPEVETEAELEQAPVTQITPAGEEKAVEQPAQAATQDYVYDENTLEEISGAYPPEPEGGSAAIAKQFARQEANAPAQAPAELPATASPYFLLAAAGTLSALSGLGLKRARGGTR